MRRVRGLTSCHDNNDDQITAMGERRKQEIEEKKARLAELRRARAERQKLLAQAETGSSDVRVVAAGQV